MAIQVLRVVCVVALLGAAAALATPKGRLPLALRGLRRMMRRDGLVTASADDVPRAVSAGRRTAAFALVLAAVALAILF